MNTTDQRNHSWRIIGAGSGWGAQNMGTADGPKVLMANCPDLFREVPALLSYWHDQPLSFSNPIPLSASQAQEHLEHILKMTTWLQSCVQDAILQGKTPLVFGGDHSTAIGTWSGAKTAFPQEDIGLIWIDAHMDAHTPQTSPSLNIHGMPVAVLLGQGDARLTEITGAATPILKPENLCLIGIHSFEEGEASLLDQLGVRIYTIEDVRKQGFSSVFTQAISQIPADKFGLSIDIDGFDPTEAPGTGTPEKGGLHFKDVVNSLSGLAKDPRFLGLEIVEFNPHLDHDNMTCQLIWDLVKALSEEASYDDKYNVR
jgi:arginase